MPDTLGRAENHARRHNQSLRPSRRDSRALRPRLDKFRSFDRRARARRGNRSPRNNHERLRRNAAHAQRQQIYDRGSDGRPSRDMRKARRHGAGHSR